MPVRAKEFTQHTVANAKPKDKPYELRDGRGHGLILRVQPNGRKYWYCSLKDGKRFPLGEAGPNTLKMAREHAEETRRLGTTPAKKVEQDRPKEKAPVPTLREFIEEEYGKFFEAHHIAGKHLDNFAVFKRGDLWNKKLSELTVEALDKWVTKRLTTPSFGRIRKPASKATVKRNVGALKAALNQALKWKVIPENPLEHYSPVQMADEARTRYLSTEEQKRLLKALDEVDAEQRKAYKLERERLLKRWKDNPSKLHTKLGNLSVPYLRSLVLLALHTGTRQRQLLRLEWRDVNMKAKLLELRPETSKTKKRRYIPLNKDAVAAIRALGTGEGTEALFPGRWNKGRFLVNINGPWKELLKRAGIAEFRFHDLRHSFASNLVTRGVDLYSTQQLLGHSDSKLTSRYAHLAPDFLRNAVAKLEKP